MPANKKQKGKGSSSSGKQSGKSGKTPAPAPLLKDDEPIVIPVEKKRKPRKVVKPKVPPRLIRKKVAEKKRALAISSALKIQKKVIKGHDGDRTRVRKGHTTVRFKRPRTFRPPRNPKFPRKAIPKRCRMDAYNIIDYPLSTEAAMKKIEETNTLVFIVHPKATRLQVKAATAKLYHVAVSRVNTLIRPDGKKKAYVKLKAECDALDVANKIGII